jgi:hypothetical protein
VGDANYSSGHDYVVEFLGYRFRFGAVDFEQREGVRVTRVYNGCGILVTQMHSGTRPDAYFSCDVSFMDQVRDLFEPPVTITGRTSVRRRSSTTRSGVGSIWISEARRLCAPYSPSRPAGRAKRDEV